MDTELWLIVGAMVVFFAQWLMLLWAQNKITRLESTLRMIRCDCQVVLENIGPLSLDDAPDLDRLRAIAFDRCLVGDL
jgi:hypothetical protein